MQGIEYRVKGKEHMVKVEEYGIEGIGYRV
jgi:hypothetical protein